MQRTKSANRGWDQMPIPQWTQEMFRQTGGRDHLGLESVAQDRLLPYLSPDIIVGTVHPRYWSFYAFLLDEFWSRDLPRSRLEYREFFRPRESIFVAAVLNCDRPEHSEHGPVLGIVGSEKVGAIVASDPPSYDPEVDYIGDPLGGYGAIYAGVLYSMGLVQPKGPGLPYDAPTPEGRLVAAGFREAVAETRYYQEFFEHPSKKVPKDVVLEYGRAACVCQLRSPAAPDRSLLRDVFVHAGGEDEANRRRQTMRMMLDVADQTSTHPVSVECFRQLIHYHECWHGPDESLVSALWTPRPDVRTAARHWRAYQVHEYYAFALKRLWWHLSDWGVEATDGGTRSLGLDDLWDYLQQETGFSTLAAEFNLEDPGLDAKSTLDDVLVWVSSLVDEAANLDAHWPRGAEVDEHELYVWGRDPGTEGETIPGMLLMLLLAFARVGAPSVEANYPDVWRLLGLGGVQRLGMTRFLTRLRGDHMRRAPLRSVVRWIYQDYIVDQHQRVAVAKLPDDTYRFRREGNRLWFQEHDNRVVMPNSRYAALSGAVHELGFVGSMRHAGHPLLPDGESFLITGELDARPVTAPGQP